ncbi:F-box protein PP2-B10 [Capsicum galapagoense]
MENSNSNSNPNIQSLLPEDCTEKILSFTSPVDVCRVSLVSKSLQSAADSDSVWEKFLPSDYQSIISGSVTPIPDFASKKELYVYLCHNPILIDAGRKSFSLEKCTGKKCYILGARDLHITWADSPQYWEWTSLPDSRFPKVAKLKQVWWLEIRGTIRVGVLSPRTSYAAYLVYKLENEFGFHYRPSEVSVGVLDVKLDKQFATLQPKGRLPQYGRFYILSSRAKDGRGIPDDKCESSVANAVRYWQGKHLPEDASNIQLPKLRNDGWFEVELGQFYTENEDDCLEMSLKEVKDCLSHKKGLIVEGIEIRPRMG